MKQWSEQLAAMGRERQKNFLDYCQRMTRENFIYNLHRKEMNYMTLPEQNFATRFAPFVNERNVMGIMDELSEAQRKRPHGVLRLLAKDDCAVETMKGGKTMKCKVSNSK